MSSNPNPGYTRNQYAVTVDGQRFLVNQQADGAISRSIMVVVNWAGDVEEITSFRTRIARPASRAGEFATVSPTPKCDSPECSARDRAVVLADQSSGVSIIQQVEQIGEQRERRPAR
jgi:hypothetical protein